MAETRVTSVSAKSGNSTQSKVAHSAQGVTSVFGRRNETRSTRQGDKANTIRQDTPKGMRVARSRAPEAQQASRTSQQSTNSSAIPIATAETVSSAIDRMEVGKPDRKTARTLETLRTITRYMSENTSNVDRNAKRKRRHA